MNKINFVFAHELLGTLLVFACKKSPTPTNNNDSKSLYERLGGITAISEVTEQFLTNVATDTAINADFAATVANPYRLKLLCTTEKNELLGILVPMRSDIVGK